MEHGTNEEGNSFAAPLPCGWMNKFPKMMVLSRADDSKSIFRLWVPPPLSLPDITLPATLHSLCLTSEAVLVCASPQAVPGPPLC
jgi:hypothetical protein